MIPPRPRPPAARQKAISQPDAEVPESVYHALLAVQRGQEGLATEMRAGFAAQAVTNSKLTEAVERAGALSVERWTNLAKALVPAVVAIVGGTYGVQRLAAPEPQRMTVVSQSALAVDLDACMTLPESNQRPCQDAAYDRDRLRKVSRQRP